MTRPKKIGIDARFYNEAGPGRYAKNIVQHLEKFDTQNTYYIFLSNRGMAEYMPNNPNFHKVRANYPWYSFAEQIFFLFKVLSFNLDLFYVPHFNIPILYPKKLITAIPDLIMHTYTTEEGTTLWKPYYRFKKFVYKKVVWWAVLRSKRVIVPTQDALNNFLEVFPKVSKDKYVVAPEGVDPDFKDKPVNSKKILSDLGISKPFIFYVGSMYGHKNVPMLVDAFKILVEKHGFTGNLVLVGKKDKFSIEMGEKVKNMSYENRILLPGLKRYVTDEEVIGLRKEAEMLVFPSLKEGFSLTPMEAQIVGLACVISDIPCHREVYDGSVLYFDPRDPLDIVEKVNYLLNNEDLKKNLISKGYEQIKKYSWDETAQITLKVFKDFLKN